MNPQQQQKPKKRPDWLLIIIMVVLFVGIFIFINDLITPSPIALGVEEIKNELKDGHISEIYISPDNNYNANGFTIEGKFKTMVGNDYSNKTFITVLVFESDVIEIRTIVYQLQDNNIDIVLSESRLSGFNIWSFLLNLLPIIIFVVLMVIMFRSAGNQNKQAFDFAKNRARLTKTKTVTFEDVAGADEEKLELNEIIDFLKNPKKYKDIGARIPKGVMLVGAPGTGKTLLAKAVAGEASVPFYSISGSDFVEMFVGVGASRVRDLFKVAKENAPCIIFIDEIDAVGRQRGSGIGGGHDEREQTLNQLLVEMDGFNPNIGIIIMAATNRPDVLDPALLRPGRFDRLITIDLPDVKAREAILKVHARNKHLDTTISLAEVSQRIPGFSGADIENLLNEAALLAARANRNVLSESDIDEAIDRVMMGPAKTSRSYNPREKKLVAYHEAGHAVIGLKLEDAAEVQKVTIIPRGRAGGYNLMTPKEETFLETKDSLLATITGFLGGRVAEEVAFDSVTTGAHNDFQRATQIARAMVTEYGMSDLGPLQYEQAQGNVFLGRDYMKEKNYSDKVGHEIDIEVRKIIDHCHATATKIITENRDLLDAIANYLMKAETLNKADILEIEATGKLAGYDNHHKEKNQVSEAVEDSTKEN